MLWLKKLVLESKLDKEEVMKKEYPGRKKRGLRSSAGDQQREGSWEPDKPAYEKGCLLVAKVPYGADSMEG